MKYGIFSDVHGNLEALEAVIAAYQGESIDRYLCVGDVVGYGADPCKCIEKIKSLIPVTVVAGNHDWASIDLFSVAYFNPQAAKAIEWTRRELDTAAEVFLRSLPLVHTEEVFTLVHGSLDSPHDFNYIIDGYNAEQTFIRMQTAVCFVGHSHVAGVFVKDATDRLSYLSEYPIEIKKGNHYLINVGSVGQPRDGNPRACYCVFDTDSRKLDIRRAAYNIRSARGKIIKAGLPRFLGDRLLAGQ
ncbi:MAG: metallophosphoesterase [Candidatus Omnitrophota bacterium]|jgi:predicted phosphodiesterase|nr:MAG: metallophosphoesterase [Candidatus Omnitrophota bacterium]